MGTAPQTSIADRVAGVPGQLYGSGHKIEPVTNEEATAGMPFGIMVKNGTAARLAKLPAATSDKLAGIVVLNHAYNRDTELDTDGIQPKATFGILREGCIHVLLEQNVAVGDAVRVRAVATGAEQAGAFRATQDTADCIDISDFASWRTGGTSGGTAVLEINMTGASLAVADV